MAELSSAAEAGGQEEAISVMLTNDERRYLCGMDSEEDEEQALMEACPPAPGPKRFAVCNEEEQNKIALGRVKATTRAKTRSDVKTFEG